MLEIDTENRRRSLKYLESPCSFLLTLSRISFKCAAKKSACPKTSCREKRCRCRCQTACVEGCEDSSVGRNHVEIVVVQLRAAHLVGTVKAQGDVFIMNILQLSLAGPQATSAPRKKIIMQLILWIMNSLCMQICAWVLTFSKHYLKCDSSINNDYPSIIIIEYPHRSLFYKVNYKYKYTCKIYIYIYNLYINIIYIYIYK